MKRNSATRWLVQSVRFMALVIGLSGAGPSGALPNANVYAIVMVFADGYVVAGRAFDNLNVLEAELQSNGVRGVNLHTCGADVTRSLMAAVHRFHRVPVQIRVFDVDEPECRAPVRSTAHGLAGATQRPFGIDDKAVELFWREAMP